MHPLVSSRSSQRYHFTASFLGHRSVLAWGTHLLPLGVEQREQYGVARVVWARGHPEAAPDGQEAAEAKDEDKQRDLCCPPHCPDAQLGV